MISHHAEFLHALCTETWLVGDGKVVVKGSSASDSAVDLPAMAESSSVNSRLDQLDMSDDTMSEGISVSSSAQVRLWTGLFF